MATSQFIQAVGSRSKRSIMAEDWQSSPAMTKGVGLDPDVQSSVVKVVRWRDPVIHERFLRSNGKRGMTRKRVFFLQWQVNRTQGAWFERVIADNYRSERLVQVGRYPLQQVASKFLTRNRLVILPKRRAAVWLLPTSPRASA